MSEELDPALLNEVAAQEDTHPVCLLCEKDCKRPYSFWSFQMPPWAFCEEFKEKEGAISEVINQAWRC